MNQKNSSDLIPFSQPYLSIEETSLIQDALCSTWISDGPYRESLEKEFARMHGVPFAVSVCNGTAALEMVLRTLNLTSEDEVIVPGYTFPAPYNMALAVGAKIIYADIDPKTWCMNPLLVESLVTAKTRAIIAVHVYGNICNMAELKSIAQKHQLVLIEDCAQSIFSSYEGSYTGTFGDYACFSFQATKTITTGEGGMVIAGNSDIEARFRQLRNHGMSPDRRYWHDVIGFNYRMTNLQAAMGCAQLKKSDEIISKKKKILQWYTQILGKVDGITMQFFEKKLDPVIWSLGVQVDPHAFAFSRDQIIQLLFDRGIETRCGFYSPSEMPLYKAPPLPVSESVGRNMIVLPAFTALTQTQVDRICTQLLKLRK